MKITSKEYLKKPVIPAKPAPYRDTGAGIQGLKNRGKSSADWMPTPVSRYGAGFVGMTPKVLLQDFPGFSSFLCLAYSLLLASAILPTAAIAAEASTKTEAKTEAKSLGRLFYTPEQRLQIDRLKNRPGQAGTTIGNTISVNGIVQRKNGGGEGSVVWINGVAQSRENADGLLAGRDIAPDAASVKVPGASKVVRLKVGQTLDLNSGTVRNISVAPVAGKDTPAENEQARPAGRAGQVDAPAQQPVQGSKDKLAPPYGKAE